jgi:hypothetical protein
LCDRTAGELLMIRNFDEGVLAEVRAKLATIGLGLGLRDE